MIVYRVGKTQFSRDLMGEGARLYGGRWNNIGTPCLYTSSSRALAVLEFSVNVNIENLPKSLSFTIIEIPDNIQEFHTKDLPKNWNITPAPSASRDFGSHLLDNAAYPVIKIPSIIIPQEFNFLLNPKHPESIHFKIIDVEEFTYDERIKTAVKL